MALAKDYKSVMGRSNDIMKKALGLDYDEFEKGGTVFDYDALMKSTNYTLDEIEKIQSRTGVGDTPLLELRNISALARKYASLATAQESWLRTKLPTLPEALRTEEPLAQLLMLRSWDTRALWLLLPATTEQQLHLRQLCRAWNV